MDYNGQSALITGAASGLGRGLALSLARRGASLALIDLSLDGLEETARQAREAGAPLVTVYEADVRNAALLGAAIDAAAADHAVIGVVCANAGVGFAGVTFSQLRDEDVQWVFGVNTFGVLRTVQCALPFVRAHGRPARILCTASIAALSASPGWHIGLYAASKASVAALAQSMRDDIGNEPISVSVAYPGLVQTQIAANAEALRPPGGARSDDVAGLDTTQGITADQAAEICIRGMEEGLHDIFTHPEEVAAVLRERAAPIERDLKASARITGRVLA